MGAFSGQVPMAGKQKLTFHFARRSSEREGYFGIATWDMQVRDFTNGVRVPPYENSSCRPHGVHGQHVRN